MRTVMTGTPGVDSISRAPDRSVIHNSAYFNERYTRSNARGKTLVNCTAVPIPPLFSFTVSFNKITVVWDMTPCKFVYSYRRFEGVSCIILFVYLDDDGKKLFETSISVYQCTRQRCENPKSHLLSTVKYRI
jgi:hypothetical protein